MMSISSVELNAHASQLSPSALTTTQYDVPPLSFALTFATAMVQQSPNVPRPVAVPPSSIFPSTPTASSQIPTLPAFLPDAQPPTASISFAVMSDAAVNCSATEY